MTNAQHLITLARDKGVMVATAESCTGGLLAGALTEVAGASDVFERGFVTYSNAAKTELLDVAPALIETNGAVSEAVARAMADGALAQSRAQIALSITGVAGPGGTAQKPEGMVCFGLAVSARDTVTVTRQFGALGRAQVRASSVDFAITKMVDALLSLD